MELSIEHEFIRAWDQADICPVPIVKKRLLVYQYRDVEYSYLGITVANLLITAAVPAEHGMFEFTRSRVRPFGAAKTSR